MIKILNSILEVVAVIKDSYNPWRFEEINGENSLSFSAILTEKVASYVNESYMVEIDDDYFDIAYYSKDINEDGTCTMSVECEHVSYRLNDEEYNVEYFTEIGTPYEIFEKILDGTGFTIGTISFTTTLTYSAQEEKSRRQLLMEFVALLGGEVSFNKFEISINERRGSTDQKIFTKGKNIKVINQVYNGREEVPTTAYTCTPLILPDKDISLGDDILLIQPELGIEDTLRVVSKGYNPYDNMLAEIEIANYINGLEDQLYKIETTTLQKEKVYNGTRIGPANGFENILSNNMARSYFNSTGLAMQVGDGTGENWVDKLYIEVDPVTGEAQLMFDGLLSTTAIEAIKAEIDVVVSNTVIVQNLYSEYGRIAKLSVSELNTSFQKIINYLASNTDPVYYTHDYEQYKQWVVATTDGTDSVQETDLDSNPLYWVDNTHKGMTITDTEGLEEVRTYVYEEQTKLDISFREVDGVIRPLISMGAGLGIEGFPDRGKFFIDKDLDGGLMKYIAADGTEYILRIGENGFIFDGVEALSALNFFANGFTATYENTTVGYRWTKNVDGEITELQDIYSGNTVTVDWSDTNV